MVAAIESCNVTLNKWAMSPVSAGGSAFIESCNATDSGATGPPARLPDSSTKSCTCATKNLSVNNVDRERHFAERDDRCGDVVEGKETAMELLVAHEQLAKAVEPTVADLNHPAPGLPCRVTPFGISLLAATHDLRDVAVRLDDLQCTTAAIAGVGAQVLAAADAWRLSLDHDGLQHGIELCDIMLIRPGYDERQRDATAVHQQMPLAPLFFPDPSGWARQTLAPAAP